MFSMAISSKSNFSVFLKATGPSFIKMCSLRIKFGASVLLASGTK